jgi:hypothetical protein
MQSVTVERRGCGLGCIIAALGLVLGCCLLPYLMSSMYSITTSVLQVPGAPGWLWGDLLNEVVESGSAGYMLFAEGPICCVGSLALLIVVFGIVMLVTSLGRRDEEPDEIYEPYETAQPTYPAEYAEPEGDRHPEGYRQPEHYRQSSDYGQPPDYGQSPDYR